MADKDTSLNTAKLVTADILGQATAMGVRLNEGDEEARNNLMREVQEGKEEATPEPRLDIESLPDEEEDRIVSSLQEEAAGKFVLEPDIPSELKEELEQPDFEAQAEEELEEETPHFEDASYNWQSEEGWDELDQEVIEERKKRIAAEKKAAYYENLRIKSDRKRWAAEAIKYFPLAGSAIEAGHLDSAKSRKDFLRKAKTAHDQVLPYVKHAIELRDATIEEEARTEREKARREAIRAWGRPLSGPGIPSRTTHDYESDLAEARSKGDLTRAIGIIRKRSMAEANLEEGE